MRKIYLLLPLITSATCTWAEVTTTELDDIVVTAVKPNQPIQLSINPKSAIQPIPATDGAGLLKTIPNMSVIRKGGSSGDPVFRGLGGSRLSITADDQFIFGGCAGRMDPPTAYIFPAAYDEVLITKGPQSVTHGPGMVAGSIAFIRDQKRFEEPTITGNFNILTGQPNRMDAMIDITAGNEWGYARLNGNYNKADDYKDGTGQRIHSEYKRHNGNLSLGLTPTENTWIETSYEQSRGKAAYADRGMDGIKFDRDAWSVKAKQKNINDWFSELYVSYGHSYVDHVMDNYTLRDVSKMKNGKPNHKVMNPDRTNDTMKLMATLDIGSSKTKIGMDWSKDTHRTRPMVMMAPTAAIANQYTDKPFTWDQEFKQYGFFAENQWYLTETKRLVSGIRHDEIKANYNEKNGVASSSETIQKNNHLLSQKYHLNAAFVRYEQKNDNWTTFIGYGMADRSPDYWERNRAFGGALLKKETNHEIDAGFLYQNETIKGSLTTFASRINNFILLQDGGIAKNVDANRLGFEGDIAWQFMPHWTVGTSIAYTYGKNKTEHRPLAQIAPLENKTYLNWDNGTYSAGLLMRTAAKQNRYAEGQGNLAAVDTGPSAGFTVFSAHAGWKINKNIQLLAGVDNIFNRSYADFNNRNNSGIFADLPATKRINEPGRQAWLRLQGEF